MTSMDLSEDSEIDSDYSSLYNDEEMEEISPIADGENIIDADERNEVRKETVNAEIEGSTEKREGAILLLEETENNVLLAFESFEEALLAMKQNNDECFSKLCDGVSKAVNEEGRSADEIVALKCADTVHKIERARSCINDAIERIHISHNFNNNSSSISSYSHNDTLQRRQAQTATRMLQILSQKMRSIQTV